MLPIVLDSIKYHFKPIAQEQKALLMCMYLQFLGNPNIKQSLDQPENSSHLQFKKIVTISFLVVK